MRWARHERDGRALCVHLTAQGRKKQQELAESVRPLQKQLYGVLPVGTHQAVLTALEQMAQVMQSWPYDSAEVA